jgi:hypothetical protein
MFLSTFQAKNIATKKGLAKCFPSIACLHLFVVGILKIENFTSFNLSIKAHERTHEKEYLREDGIDFVSLNIWFFFGKR